MPNHVVCKIEAPAKTLRRILAVAKGADAFGDEQEFTFNQIVPFPGGEYTCEWGRENWGTKWDAYELTVRPRGIWFFTAWTMPDKVFCALSKRVGDFSVVYADEDIGNNCGRRNYSRGESEFIQPVADDIAVKFAKGLWAAYLRAAEARTP